MFTITPNSLFARSLPFFLFFLASTFVFCFSLGQSHGLQHATNLFGTDFGNERQSGELVGWNERRSMVETSNGTLTLAADRAYRKDPLDNYKYYTGGWNIANEHYIYSVLYSASPPIIVGIIWFVLFATCLIVIFFRHCICCCCRKDSLGYSRKTFAISLVFLIIFTLGAVAGSIVQYTGEAKFTNSTVDVTAYIIRQADSAVSFLVDLMNNLMDAKGLGVAQLSLQDDIQNKINKTRGNINKVADQFRNITGMKYKDIDHFLHPVRFTFTCIAAAMIFFTLLGFLFSMLGWSFLVYLSAFLGLFLVTSAFFISGVFLLVHNVAGDTCVAMDEYIHNPTAHSAMEELIPTIDNNTAQTSVNITKGVTVGVVGIVKNAIVNVLNAEVTADAGPLYYNQSGPFVPALCSPYNTDLSDRQCVAGEVDFNNASQVWKGYVCQVSDSNICTMPGRITPDRFEQLMASVSVSMRLYRSTPFLMGLVDGVFIRDTFSNITTNHCPDLRRYSEVTFVGFLASAIAVMLSVVLWIIHARERRHRKNTKKAMAGNYFRENFP